MKNQLSLLCCTWNVPLSSCSVAKEKRKRNVRNCYTGRVNIREVNHVVNFGLWTVRSSWSCSIGNYKPEMMLIACVFVRVFQTGSLIDRVFKTYNLMHTNQTLDFVKQKVSTSVACEIQPSVINSLSTSTLRFFRYIWLLIYVIFACVMQPYYWPRLCNFSCTKSHWFCNFCVFCGCFAVVDWVILSDWANRSCLLKWNRQELTDSLSRLNV